jgi:hypothetical protein
MKGYCEKDGLRIGFGEVSGKVLPAVQFDFARIIPRRNSVKLYSYFRSSAAYRVRIALNLKNSKLTLFRFICLKMAVNSKVLPTVKLTQANWCLLC